MSYRVIGLSLLLVLGGTTGVWAQPRAYVGVNPNQVAVIDTITNEVLPNKITVGQRPTTIVTTGTRAYVVCEYDRKSPGTVSVIDTNDNQVIATIGVGADPYGAALDDNYLYVTSSGGDHSQNGTVSVIDVVKNEVVRTITLGKYPLAIAVRDNQAYVTNIRSDSVSVIDTKTFAVKNVTVGDSPDVLALTDKSVYVVNEHGASVSVIDRSTLAVKTVAVGDKPGYVAVTNKWVYVTNQNDNNVSVIDRNTNTALPNKITVGAYPQEIVATPSGSRVYVANNGSDSVSVIDPGTNTVIKTLTVGASPYYARLGVGRVYVSNQSSKDVSVIDTLSDDVQTIPNVGTFPGAAAVSSSPLYGVMINQEDLASNNLTVIDPITNSVQATVPLPRAIALAVDNRYVYVTNRAKPNTTSGTLSVVDRLTNKLVDTVTLPNSTPVPWYVAVNSDRICVLAPPGALDQYTYVILYDVETRALAPSNGLKGGCYGAAFVGNRLFVSNREKDNVTVLDAMTGKILEQSIPVGSEPIGVGASASRVYVANTQGNSVSAIETDAPWNTVEIPLKDQTTPSAPWVTDSRVYTANTITSAVSVIDRATNQVIQTIPAANNPQVLASIGSRLYVANQVQAGSAVIQVFDTETYKEVGQISLDRGLPFLVVATRSIPAEPPSENASP